MQYKVKYPDDYIREKRSIIAAAELTYVRMDRDLGEAVVVTGEDTCVLAELDRALDLAATCILGDGPLDSLGFTLDEDGAWRPDIHGLRRDLSEVGRRRKK